MFTGRCDLALKYFERALRCDQHQTIAQKGLIKAYYNIGSTEEALKHLEHVQKLSTDLAAPENDLFDDGDIKLTLGIRLRQADQFFRANELFFDAFKRDGKM